MCMLGMSEPNDISDMIVLRRLNIRKMVSSPSTTGIPMSAYNNSISALQTTKMKMIW